MNVVRSKFVPGTGIFDTLVQYIVLAYTWLTKFLKNFKHEVETTRNFNLYEYRIQNYKNVALTLSIKPLTV